MPSPALSLLVISAPFQITPDRKLGMSGLLLLHLISKVCHSTLFNILLSGLLSSASA